MNTFNLRCLLLMGKIYYLMLSQDWMDLFDFVFIKAQKPSFFINKNKAFLLDLQSPTLKGAEI